MRLRTDPIRVGWRTRRDIATWPSFGAVDGTTPSAWPCDRDKFAASWYSLQATKGRDSKQHAMNDGARAVRTHRSFTRPTRASKSRSCRTNPAFGRTTGRTACITPRAASKWKHCSAIKYAIHTLPLRLTPCDTGMQRVGSG